MCLNVRGGVIGSQCTGMGPVALILFLPTSCGQDECLRLTQPARAVSLSGPRRPLAAWYEVLAVLCDPVSPERTAILTGAGRRP